MSKTRKKVTPYNWSIPQLEFIRDNMDKKPAAIRRELFKNVPGKRPSAKAISMQKYFIQKGIGKLNSNPEKRVVRKETISIDVDQLYERFNFKRQAILDFKKEFSKFVNQSPLNESARKSLEQEMETASQESIKAERLKFSKDIFDMKA